MGATAVFDLSKVESGGVRRATATRNLFDIYATVDLEPLFDLPGATLFVDLHAHEGADGSDLTGDFQGYGKIDAPDFREVAELWYEQWLLDDLLRVKLGKVDANSEFAFVEHGDSFL